MDLTEINSHLSKALKLYKNSDEGSLQEIIFAILLIKKKNHNNPTGLVRDYHNLSDYFNKLGVFKFAYIFIGNAINTCNKYIKNDVLLAELYEQYAIIAHDACNLTSALKIYDKLLAYYQVNNSANKIIKCKEKIDEIHLLINSFIEPLIVEPIIF
jgi:tetratricopeptide (TPR) repeat protein